MWTKIVLVVAIILGVGYVWRDNPRVENALPTPSPSLDPFAELTIPYLRSREYQSQLRELTKYSESASYTTYLTSYDSDGLKVNGLLTIPKGQGRHPAIVFVHGYIAPSVYKTTEKYGDYVDYLARNGFVVFKIDLRGNGDSEGEPGGAYYSGDYVIDTLNAYAALEKAEFVDPSRIGLWGHSMAGNVVFRSVVAAKDIPAAVIWAGAGYTYDDLRTYRIMDTSYRPPQGNNTVTGNRQKLREMHGEFDSSDPFWASVAPTNYLEGVTTPLQINHAVDDQVVSIEYSRNLMRVLDSSQLIHELNEYPNGGHNISGAAFGPAMRATVEFYKLHLR